MTIRYGTSNAETISPVGKAWTTGYGTGAFSASNNSSPDIVYAGSGNDTIYYLTSLADNDLFGEDGNDTLTGGVGHDLLDGGNGDDKLTGGIGSDDLLGGAGIDTLLGGDGNDNLNGGADNDTLTGGNGIDRFIIDNTSTDIVKDLGVGQDSLFVGAGSTANVTVTAAWTATSQTQNRGVANLKTTVDVDLSLAKDSLLTTGFNVTATGAAGVILKGSAKGDTLNGGAGIDTLYGNAGDDNINGGAQGDTLVGGLGNDTYVVDNIFDVVSENAGEGTDLIQAGVSYALSADVENLTLIGTGMINGTGNGGNNAIIGNTGNNILNGGAGVDSLAGGAGNDTYVVDNAGDQVNELAGQGTDLVQSSIDFSLASKASTPDVENLTLTGSAVSGTGNAQNNIIRGNTANNTLDGAAGADTMKGGNGDDSYYVDNSGDIITELSAQGSDTVFSSITYALSANVENLILTGSANINGTGNSLSNYLWGNSGDNSLNGGTGADTMIGDGGDDTYYVDNVGDVVTEAPGQGNDSVYSSISYTLTADVESLTLTGASAINGAGNKGNNAITGNTGNNILDGGANADTLTGGLGNDTYVVDNAGDVVVELLAEGTDLVKSSSVNIDLTSLGAVENITLTGVANLNATGNVGINTILGNNGDNVITGGAGADILKGGLGNDTYIVNVNALGALEDTVTETSTGGVDTIQLVGASAAATLTVAATIENFDISGTNISLLNVTGSVSGNVLTGNSAANTLKGMAGNDTINGGVGNDLIVGGAGNDTLTGANGADVFFFETAANATTNLDHITDFATANDILQFSKAKFAALTTLGQFVAGDARFASNTTGLAGDATDRLIYNTGTGDLSYDKDGTGVAAPVVVGVLDGAPSLAATDIWVVA